MYHSGVNAHHPRTIGRSGDCHLVLDDASVSRRHATAVVTPEGFLAVQDLVSANGTWLQRNGRWIRVRRAILGMRDRIRFGEQELPLERLVELFGRDARIRLREGYSVRGRPLLRDDLSGERSPHRVVLENPRRNPLTGDIEENR